MKRKPIVCVFLVAAALVASCMRDEDWDLLKHPVHVTGQVDPNLGAPIGYGKLTVNDMISMLNSNYTGHFLTGDDVVAIVFDTVLHANLHDMASAQPSTMPRSPFAKAAGIDKDTTIRYGLDLTLFNDAAVDSMLNGHISISSLMFSMNTFLKAECPDTAEQIIRQYASAVVDNLEVRYTGHDGGVYPFTDFTFAPITISALLDGDSIQKDIEMSEIINRLPTHIEVSYQLHFHLDGQFFTDHSGDANYSAMLDSIAKLYIHYDAQAHAEMPLDAYINDLPYDLNINFSGDSLAHLDLEAIADSISSGLEVHLKESYLILNFDNGLPMQFAVSAILRDENGNPVGDSIIQDNTVLSAVTQPVGGASNSYKVQKSTTSLIRIHLDESLIPQLKQASQLNLKLRVSSGDNTAAGNPVIVGPDDFLRVKVCAQLHPSASYDMRLTNSGIMN